MKIFFLVILPGECVCRRFSAYRGKFWGLSLSVSLKVRTVERCLPRNSIQPMEITLVKSTRPSPSLEVPLTSDPVHHILFRPKGALHGLAKVVRPGHVRGHFHGRHQRPQPLLDHFPLSMGTVPEPDQALQRLQPAGHERHGPALGVHQVRKRACRRDDVQGGGDGEAVERAGRGESEIGVALLVVAEPLHRPQHGLGVVVARRDALRHSLGLERRVVHVSVQRDGRVVVHDVQTVDRVHHLVAVATSLRHGPHLILPRAQPGLGVVVKVFHFCGVSLRVVGTEAAGLVHHVVEDGGDLDQVPQKSHARHIAGAVLLLLLLMLNVISTTTTELERCG